MSTTEPLGSGRDETIDQSRDRAPDQVGEDEELRHERRAVDADRTEALQAAGYDRQAVLDREREEFGGIKIGSAFFGWLTATGTAVLLVALVAAAGAAVGVSTNTDPKQATGQAVEAAGTVGIVSGIVLLVILFVAYYCGGYVAGRMARFNGPGQGLAVWLWAIFIAALVAVLATIAGRKYDVLSTLNSFPRIPLSSAQLTTGGLVALVVLAVAALAGALLGGAAGMRFHRKVDRAGLGE